MYRFLLSPRWLGFAVFVIAMMAVSIRLGFWQLDKLDERLERNETVEAHFAADPVPLDSVVPPGSRATRDQEWTRVLVNGTYAPDGEVTVKFVNRDGVPGVDVVTPLILGDGTAILVNRGFLGTPRTNAPPEDVPQPPPGDVEISAWLRVDSGAGPEAIEPDDGQVRAISSAGLSGGVPYELRSGFLNLREQSPEPDSPLLLELEPELGQGPHFFYALQWWFFAGLAGVGYIWFARVERKQGRPDYEGQLVGASSGQ